VVIRGFSDIFEFIIDSIRSVLALFGISTDAMDIKKGASVGAAVRSASKTSVEDVISKAQVAAFSLGSASGDPAGRTASAAEEIKKKADLIYEFLKGLPKDIANALAMVLGRFGDAAVEAGDIIGDTFRGIRDTAKGAVGIEGPAFEWRGGVARAFAGDGPGVVGGAGAP
jgi:hypothetical protein